MLTGRVQLVAIDTSGVLYNILLRRNISTELVTHYTLAKVVRTRTQNTEPIAPSDVHNSTDQLGTYLVLP